MPDLPLHIVTLSTLFPQPLKPNFGIFVGQQTQYLAALPHMDVRVVNPIGIPPWPLSRHSHYHPLSTLKTRDEWRNLPIYRPRFTLIPKMGGALNPYMIVRAILPLIRDIHAQRPIDIIDCEFFHPDGYVGAQIAMHLGIPFTIKARGADIHHWGKKPATRRQIIHAASKANHIFAVSEALREDMIAMHMPAEKISVHYTGLDRALFSPQIKPIDKQEIGIHGPMMVSVGALIKRKNQHLLIKALRYHKNLSLLLIGEGEERGHYGELAQKLGVKERVHFAGNIAHAKLGAYLAAADIAALVSQSEGLANAWVEALACGTPLILSEAGGAAELARDGRYARITAQHPKDIAQSIEYFLKNRPPREAVAQSVSHFSWEENSRQLSEHFHRIASQRR